MGVPEPLLKVARSLPPGVRARLRSVWARSRGPMRTEPDHAGWTRRLRAYNEPQQPGLLSFVTTVWNTPAVYLNALAESVFGQIGGTEFEWFILDNGSDDPACRTAMSQIAAHPCVRLERVDENLGIIGGMQYCLERARGRYVLPLDSDDLLSPDCVRVLTTSIVENKYPALLYSDEDKLLGDLHTTPYYKPDWDPVLFAHSCYIAHLCALDRELALKYGCYSDPACEGCHDWDSFTRFYLAGHTPVHAPETVYSWRMHQNSTSSNIGSKPVVYTSHQALLHRFLSGAARPDLFTVEQSPLFGGAPDWRLRRRRETEGAPLLTTVVVTGGSSTEGLAAAENDYPGHRVLAVPRTRGLRGLAEALNGVEGLVHVLSGEVRIGNPDWAWEALGLMELFPDTVAVGGRILDRRGLVLNAGGFFGVGSGCDPLDRGRPPEDPGYFATVWKPHSVSVVSAAHAVFRAGFLAPLVNRLADRPEATFAFLGAWAGAEARRQGARVVYSPFLLALDAEDWDAAVSDEERATFVLAHADLLPEAGLLSRHLGMSPVEPFSLASAAERDRHRNALLAWAESVRRG
jgi:hypothetical protein